MQQRMHFQCAKCNSHQYETGQVRMSGGFWSSFFNLENKRFTTVTCTQCGYTEMYRGEVGTLAKIFDFFGS
ncbi:MAG: zinc ribbon domain-containing protein [Chloroflexi bacterium]|nr:zinc ribbon domain-containing protein [Chloroflexota bacterium]